MRGPPGRRKWNLSFVVFAPSNGSLVYHPPGSYIPDTVRGAHFIYGLTNTTKVAATAAALVARGIWPPRKCASTVFSRCETETVVGAYRGFPLFPLFHGYLFFSRDIYNVARVLSRRKKMTERKREREEGIFPFSLYLSLLANIARKRCVSSESDLANSKR